MVSLHIIRGLPDSGKSTYARNNLFIIPFEADDFFETSDGYKWSRNFLPYAHTLCKMQTIKNLYDGRITVVANTFTTIKELQPYYDLRKIFPDLHIVIHEMHTQYEPTRYIPLETIERMKQRWQNIPSDWNVCIKQIYPDWINNKDQTNK